MSFSEKDMSFFVDDMSCAVTYMSFTPNDMSFCTVFLYSTQKDMSSMPHDMFSASAYLSSGTDNMQWRTGCLSLQVLYMAFQAIYLSSGPEDMAFGFAATSADVPAPCSLSLNSVGLSKKCCR